jgi:molybdopterin-guanine dinucleotide biosynthesis protein A
MGTNRFAILILAGGKSLRMGKDKTGILFEGKPLLRHLIDRLGTRDWDLFVAGGSPDHELPTLPPEVSVFPDLQTDQGPLAAFASFANKAAAYRRILVLACDLPFFQHTHARILLSHTEGTPIHGSEVQAWIPMAGGQRQVLAGVYKPEVFRLARKIFGEGERRMQFFLDALDFALLPQEDEKPFLNWNSPGDL